MRDPFSDESEDVDPKPAGHGGAYLVAVQQLHGDSVFRDQCLVANSWGPTGLLLRNNSSGGLITFGVGAVSGQAVLRVARWTNATTFNSDYFTSLELYKLPHPINWLRIVDNGTNRLSQYSHNNGVDWNTIHTAGRTDFITPDQIGWGGDAHSQAVIARMRAFSVV